MITWDRLFSVKRRQLQKKLWLLWSGRVCLVRPVVYWTFGHNISSCLYNKQITTRNLKLTRTKKKILLEFVVELQPTSPQYAAIEQYHTITTRLLYGRLATRLTAKLTTNPTLYYVVVTAVRRTKHSMQNSCMLATLTRNHPGTMLLHKSNLFSRLHLVSANT